MSVKNIVLAALLLLNMLLVAGLVLQVATPQPAMAQPGPGGANNYSVITAHLAAGEDGLWVIDLKARKLYAFRLPTNVQDRAMSRIGIFDLGSLRPK